MRTLHLCNTQFEFDLQQPEVPNLLQGIEANPICLQLQFLPCLYADKRDLIGVSSLPEAQTHPGLSPLSALPPFDRVKFWGASPAITELLNQENVPLSLPPWSAVQKVNSKRFSFSLSPPLPGACLLSDPEQLESWWKTRRQLSVLKSCFGVAGRGKLLLRSHSPVESAMEFCQRQWSQNLPVVAEPWMSRLLDFSSQWEIHPNGIEYLGPTLMTNTPQGVYQSTVVGDVEAKLAPYLNEHLDFAREALQVIRDEGYWGPVGIDAMVYKDPEPVLHPIVEVNARQTMASTAIKYWKKNSPKSTFRLTYRQASLQEGGLLPRGLLRSDGEYVPFYRNLFPETLT